MPVFRPTGPAFAPPGAERFQHAGANVIEVELTNHQTEQAVELSSLSAAVRSVLAGEGIRTASVSVAIVDETTIRRLNRQYLGQDDATDVLSFLFSGKGEPLDGEIVACAGVAADAAHHYGWRTGDELMLYVVHGALHLVGYDDTTEQGRAAMRARQRHYLARYHLCPRYDPAGRRALADPAGGEARKQPQPRSGNPQL